MDPELERNLIDAAWAALCTADEAAADARPDVEVAGAGGGLPSAFPVEETAVACVSAALMAAAALDRTRGGATGPVALDRGHVTAAVRSERYFRRGTEAAGGGFAPLSRFWPTADGWVRTHANYPWHRAALLSALGTSGDATDLGEAMAERPAQEIEEVVVAAGGIAAAVRTAAEWRRHAQRQAVLAEPLIGHRLAGEAAPRARPPGRLPAAGVRVLDLTRVIAGPVCTRFLAALGADVVRLDPPQRPDMGAGTVADTLLGKRSALMDLASPGSDKALHNLLDGADVVVCGYRPGALDRFGLDEEMLATRHPGVVVVFLDAWGHTGPWAGRRGFDSVVQAPTGIATGESSDGVSPGALPCQLLDHGTGYLAAAAALDGLRRQGQQGGTHVRRLSLARTAAWLTSGPRQPGGPASGAPGVEDASAWVVALDSADGPVTAVRPPGALGGRPLQWPSLVTGYGNDAPAWGTP